MSFSLFAQEECPSDNRILQKENFENHYLHFENFAYRFKGRCRGHSIVMQKSYYLMEFDTGENPNNCSLKSFTQDCQKEYFIKFSKLFFENQVIEVPGFKNLAEFASVPYIFSLLKFHVSKTPTTFKTLVAHNRFIATEVNPSIAHFKEAVERVQEFQKPYLAISSLWTGDHAVLAYRFTNDKENFKLCVRDPNLIPNQSIECENYFYIAMNAEGSEEVFYHKRNEEEDKYLLTVRIYTDEDTRVQEFIEARVNYCLKTKI